MQHVVRNLQGVSIDPDYYERKRDFLYTALMQMGYDIVKPQGAFYLFPKVLIVDEFGIWPYYRDAGTASSPWCPPGTSVAQSS